jgi:hypothetical protein
MFHPFHNESFAWIYNIVSRFPVWESVVYERKGEQEVAAVALCVSVQSCCNNGKQRSLKVMEVEQCNQFITRQGKSFSPSSSSSSMAISPSAVVIRAQWKSSEREQKRGYWVPTEWKGMDKMCNAACILQTRTTQRSCFRVTGFHVLRSLWLLTIVTLLTCCYPCAWKIWKADMFLRPKRNGPLFPFNGRCRWMFCVCPCVCKGFAVRL